MGDKMIIGAALSKEQIIDIGMDLAAQCFKFDVDQQELTTTIRLNVLGVIYSVSVPYHEANDPKNIKDAWQQALESFGVCHMMGQKSNVVHGSRDLTDEEIKSLEK